MVKLQTKIRWTGSVLSKLGRDTPFDVDIKTVSLFSKSYGFISSSALESARRVIRRKLSKSAHILIKIYPFISRTEKPSGVRMGKGKSSKIRDRVCVVVPGQVIFQVERVSGDLARAALLAAGRKLPLAVRVANLVL